MDKSWQFLAKVLTCKVLLSLVECKIHSFSFCLLVNNHSFLKQIAVIFMFDIKPLRLLGIFRTTHTGVMLRCFHIWATLWATDNVTRCGLELLKLHQFRLIFGLRASCQRWKRRCMMSDAPGIRGRDAMMYAMFQKYRDAMDACNDALHWGDSGYCSLLQWHVRGAQYVT